LPIEVRSVKSDYRSDYRYMLESITERCTDLIMQIDSPINQHFETDFDKYPETLYQRFSFVKSLIDSLEFEEAIQKIVSNPTTKWEEEHEVKDIRSIRRFNQKNIKHDFHFKYILNDKLDFPDNSFDIITCFFVLHHILDLDKIMKEIRRVLKPGGYILILEHDNHDDYDNILLDILHLLYGIYVDKNKLYLKNPDYAQYYNFMEWDYIFQKYGFKYIKSNYLFQEISHVVRYDNIYYAFYQKSMRNI
jgi:SAM-dependent methyltransferase